MFRLALMIIVILLIWLQSLLTDTVHELDGDKHVFRYNFVPWFFLGLMMLILVGFAEIARRFMKDKWVALFCLLGIPLFGLLSLQLYFERTEVSDKLISHRREPPHTEYNVDLPWDSIASAVKIERERAGLFAPNFYHVGYRFKLPNGRTHELPTNTVLTAAQEEIDRMLADRQIPVTTKRIPIPKS